MKHILSCLMAISIAAFTNVYAASDDTASNKITAQARAKITGDIAARGKARIIVRLKSDRASNRSAKRARIAARQARLSDRMNRRARRAMHRMRNIPVVTMEVASEDLAQLLASEDVEAVIEDRLLEPSLDLSVPHIGGDVAHADGHLGQGQTVVILDTGVERSHSTFDNRVVYEACFSTQQSAWSSESLCPNGQSSQFGNGAAAPCATCAHGTHVAGIAAGADPSYRGVAPDADVIAIQVFSRVNGSLLAWWSDIVRALDWVYDQRNNYDIAAVGLSLGGDRATSASACDASGRGFLSIVDQLKTVGIATVVAAGNNGWSDGLAYPGCLSSVITVGSTTLSDEMSSFSNAASWMDFVAPGSSIRSSVPGGGFSSWNGTSMAAPHVVGAFALIRSAYPDASVDEIVAALSSTATAVLDSDSGIAYNRLNIDAALEVLANGTPVDMIVDDDYDGVVSGGQFGSVVTDPQAYGGRARRSSGSGLDTYRFSPSLPVSGEYRVYAWWSESNSNSNATRYRIFHADGSTDKLVNQRTNGGRWVSLGDFQLTGSSRVEISDPNGAAMVDAVRFELLDVLGAPPVTPNPPVIASTSVPTGEVGQSYNHALNVSGGVGALSWSRTGGTLPNGIQLGNGTLSGTPTGAGSWTFTVRVTDELGDSDSKLLSLTVNAAAPVISTGSLPSGEVGKTYSATLQVQGGASPFTWALASGQLPDGLTLNSGGVISGTPTEAGLANPTVRVTDALGRSVTRSLSVNVVEQATAPPTISTTTLPDGEVGETYLATLQLQGGKSPFTWSIASGKLPNGLALNASGVISGAPTRVETANVTVRVTDALNRSGTRAFSVNVSTTEEAPPPTIITSSLPSAQYRVPYTATLQSQGGEGTVVWSISGGKLPSGLKLSSSGVITGAPTRTGPRTAVIRVTDALGRRTERRLTVAVSEDASPPSITTSSLPSGEVGEAYRATLQSQGGQSPFTWSIAGGKLPNGLALSASGVVSGAPTRVETANATVRVTDAMGLSATRTLSVNVSVTGTQAPPPTIITNALPGAEFRVPYTATLQSQGGEGQVVWSISGGKLPSGLRLSSSGVITGAPTRTGPRTAIIRVTDSLGRRTERPLTVAVPE
ncbi:MAG: putative Ig domain-containing protein [Pseudomonadota bacterium]